MKMKKNSCKKWFIFPDHDWTTWEDGGDYTIRYSDYTIYQQGYIQARKCRKCGLLQSRRVKL